MKQTFLLIILCVSLKITAQKKSWTTFFPPRDNVIGYTFIGNPMDSKVSKEVDDIKFTKRNSATILSMEQNRTNEFTMGSIFSTKMLRVVHVESKGVKLDEIDKETVKNMPRNIPFVYAGLKADSSVVTFRKSRKNKIDSAPVIDILKKIYPQLSATELGKFLDFLSVTDNSSDSSDFKITIKNPDVYFLVQVASVNNKGGNSWDRYCASFLSTQGAFVDSFNLVSTSPVYKTGNANPQFKWSSTIFNSVQQATVWLEMDSLNNLTVKSQISPTETPKTQILKERNGTWNYNNFVVRTYAYSSTSSSLLYKDVILIIDAYRKGNSIIIKSSGISGTCENTRLWYPESELVWSKFK